MALGGLKSIPPIKAVMTPFPYSIDAGERVEAARRMMEEHGFHHLPVVRAGELVGVISDRELGRGGTGESEAAPRRVGEVARTQAYVVDLTTPLDRVLAHMARHRLDAALVVKEGRLAGIFTMTDACRHFAELLRKWLAPADGDDAA